MLNNIIQAASLSSPRAQHIALRLSDAIHRVGRWKTLAFPCVILAGLFAGICSGQETDSVAPPHQGWQAGFAQADITPRPGQAMMAGFGRERYAEGALAPLLSQVLVLRDQNGKTIVLATADVLGFDRRTVEALRRKIESRHGIPANAVCFAASHTHWGPAINYRANFGIGGLNVWYLARLEQTLLELVDKAVGNLAPAEVEYGACEAQIGMNRRQPDGQGGVRWGVHPSGNYDRHTPILRIRRERSPRQVILVGHACHPTSMGPTGKWAPDYPGTMRTQLEAELEDCRAMFVMGCGGDAKVVTRDPVSGEHTFAANPQQSEAAGVHLAEEVIQRLQRDDLHQISANLRSTLVRGTLSLQPPRSQEALERLAYSGDLRSHETWWARQVLAYPDQRRQLPYEVQAWRLGDLTVIAMEGEVCAAWGEQTRVLASTDHAMMIAYANHCGGYIPTAKMILEGGYEGDASHRAYLLPAPFEPKMERELKQLLSRAIESLKP